MHKMTRYSACERERDNEKEKCDWEAKKHNVHLSIGRKKKLPMLQVEKKNRFHG